MKGWLFWGRHGRRVCQFDQEKSEQVGWRQICVSYLEAPVCDGRNLIVVVQNNSRKIHSKYIRWIFLLALYLVSGAAVSDQRDIDVDNLIGSKISAISVDRTGQLPFWFKKGGAILGYSELGLTLSEYYRDGNAIFIIAKMDSSRNQTITAANKLPIGSMNYKIVDNKIVYIENSLGRYSLEPYCKSRKETASIIIGLAKGEKRLKDCSHWTRQVKAAWIVDSSTGKLKEISPAGITCLLTDYEYSCEHMQEGE